MTERTPSEPLKVRGGVVNRTQDSQNTTQADARRKESVGARSHEDKGGNVRDPVLDPEDAPKQPPPGTGGTDGAPMD